MKVVVGLTKLNDFTGAEVYCLELVRALRDAGHEVEVFCLYSHPAMEARLAAIGVGLSTYPRGPELSPDRVVCMHPLATFLLLRRVDVRVPALAVVHGVLAGEAPVRASRIDRFVAVSPFVADHLVEHEGILREEVRVLQNGLDLARFDAPPVAASPETVRVLWASTYIPVRHDALLALAGAAERLPHVRLTVVEDRLPEGLLPESGRIEVIPKTGDMRALIERSDVVAGLGPGRIVLEGLAMNRASLCLNVAGLGEYLGEENRLRLEYYLDDWGAPLDELLDPTTVFAHQNRRSVAERHYDGARTMAAVVGELESLRRRESAPRGYRRTTLRRLPALAAAYALMPVLRVRLRARPSPAL